MKDFAKDISYRAFYLVLALGVLYMLPTIVHLCNEFAMVFFVPLLETTIQNMGK